MNDNRGNELHVGDEVTTRGQGRRRLYVAVVHERDLVVSDRTGNTWAVGPEEVRLVRVDKGAGTN